ncbi:MAG: hypothetical protein KJ963_01250, partial [Bacteroidetes bacterium]|nr:hypothetical protein [Bacteroidota bacterium]
GFESDVSDYACLPYETFRRQARLSPTDVGEQAKASSDKGMHGCGPPNIVVRTSVREPAAWMRHECRATCSSPRHRELISTAGRHPPWYTRQPAVSEDVGFGGNSPPIVLRCHAVRRG